MRTTRTLAAAAMVAAGQIWIAGAATAEEKRELGYSFNIAITSDYIFRGFSQTERAPTGQGGFDITWGKAYFGMWASGIDFNRDNTLTRAAARAEVDVYAGVKPEWNGFTFDFGGIAYLYPGARDNGGSPFLPGEANYYELKAGVSREIVKNLTLSSTLFFSPDYTNSTGRVITTETTAALVLPEIAGWTPTISGTLGYQKGRSVAYTALVGNGRDHYMYWNAGVAFAWEKFTIDFRYWDTNIKDDALFADFCTGTTFQCDGRFVASVKFTY